MSRLASFAAVIVLTLPAGARAQVSGEVIQVNVVEVPVNVVGRDGEPVRGLKPENFEVYDEGERRKITHFEEIDLARISTDPKEVFNPVARRNFLLVFDLSNSSPKALLRARQAAQEFLLEKLRERDLVSVATFSVEDSVRILTAFTTDRELVRHAITTLGHPQFYRTNDPLMMSTDIAPGLAAHSGSANSTPQQLGMEEMHDLMRFRAQLLDDDHQRGRIEQQLVTFGNLAQLLDTVRGRKHVILLSEGFSTRLVQGRERPLPLEEGQKESLALMRGEIWRIDNDSRFGNVRAQNHLDDMTRLFRRSDVVLHAIDIHGVPGSADARTGAHRISSESHFMLAEATGGEVFNNANDLGQSFARMLKQQEVIYVLGFQTKPTGNPGSFHDLTVKVKVIGHRGLRVNHRAGYYEPRLQVSAVEQRLSATDILMNDIPFEDVEVHLLAAPFPSLQSHAHVPIVAEISGADLLRGVSGDRMNLELFIYAFDEANRVKDFLFQTVSLDLPKIGKTLQTGGFKYYGTLGLPPGQYSIKSLVRVVESGSNGFRRVHVNVPRHGERAVLPPLVFEEPDQWVMLKGAKTAEGQVDYPFTLVEESFIPSARPKMILGQAYRLALFTYNLRAEEIELVARLEGANGTHQNPALRLLGRTSDREDGALKLLLLFTPKEIAPGPYWLHIVVQDQDSNSSTEVSLPLQVERAGSP